MFGGQGPKPAAFNKYAATVAQESPELVAILRRWMNAVESADKAALPNLISASEITRFIGSDGGELWSGAHVRDAIPLHMAKLPTPKFKADLIEAFEEGTVGWAAMSGECNFGGTVVTGWRITLVCTLEAGQWRVVQIHDSIPTPNGEVIGVELTTSLESLLGSLDLDARESIEGTTTIMFTDVEESTRLARLLGDRKWAELIVQHDATITDAVRECGGRIVKSLGDGSMATFAAARDALRGAAAVQRSLADHAPDLKVRVGIHTGDVVRTETDFLGHAVTKAARITSAASGGQVLVSQTTRDLIGAEGEFNFGEPFSVPLKGFEGVHQVVPLNW